MCPKGGLVISLDFELLWGMIELQNAQAYAESHVKQVPNVVEKMLSLFEKYDIKVTFATVGLLMCKNKDEAKGYFPEKKPSYSNSSLTPYGDYFDRISDNSLYFAPDTVDKLIHSNNVEIGTHTFCHYYCLEPGQNEEEFEQDLLSALKIAKAKGIQLKSIVFPRNNVNDAYLKVCYRHGILSYRGNATKFFNRPKNRLGYYKNRLGRLIDSYLPLNNKSCYDISSLSPLEGFPVNIPASRFFRPYSKTLSFLEPLRINRIKQEIKHAAKKGKIYHIWWHPHNFGANISENLKNLETVLSYFVACRKRYGMQSYTMTEITNLIINNNE